MNRIYAALFNRIIKGHYPADTRLIEDDLAHEFQVSRTPIRETLRLLQQDGLVQILPNRGARVYGFTADDLEDIYEIRRVLEVLALELTGPVLSINELMKIREQVEAAAKGSDPAKHAEADALLHRYITESSRRRRLVGMLNQLFHLMQTFRELGFQDEGIQKNTYREHMALIDALAIRDMNAAKEILQQHITNSKIRILQKVVQRSQALSFVSSQENRSPE